MSREAHTAVGWREAFGGEWTVDRAGYIWADSLKGGRCHVADVRGWGYLTGGGHGALGLSAEDAERISSEVGRLLCAAPALLEAAKTAFVHEVGARLAIAVERNGWKWPEDAPPTVSVPAERLRAAIHSATGEG